MSVFHFITDICGPTAFGHFLPAAEALEMISRTLSDQGGRGQGYCLQIQTPL